MSSITKDSILFEDDHILVINKPIGVVVNRSHTSPDETVQNFVEDYLAESFANIEDSEFKDRSGIVHRLDKPTSGLLLLAKNESAFDNLKNQFKTREVSKEYLALVMGVVEDKLITIKAPLARDPKNRIRFAVVKGGRFALTNAEVLKTFEDRTLLLVKPMTGRTHQIRVHMSAINHPIMGDARYLGRKRFGETFALYHRLMLHALRLKFTHPFTDIPVEFETPIPPEFEETYSKLEL